LAAGATSSGSIVNTRVLTPASWTGQTDTSAPRERGLDGDEKIVDVAVAGAGVVGVATAYALARRGLSVVLVDRAPHPAMGASFANGAQLSYAYSDALGSPSLLKKLPALALGADPAFRVKAALDPHLIAWGLRFLHNSSAGAHQRNTLETLALGLESQQALHALLARHPLEFGFADAGKMHLYYDTAALAAAAEMVALKAAHGATQHILTAAEARLLEPALSGVKALAGVVYSPGDEVGDPHRFSQELTGVLSEVYGVRMAFGFDVARAELGSDEATLTARDGQRIRARTLVVALGAEAPRFLRRLGVRVPILPMKGYSFTAPTGSAAPQVSITDTQRKIVFCRLSGQMRVAGVAELGNRDLAVDPRRSEWLLDAARASLPEAADYDSSSTAWTGLRPMTPTSTPIITRPRQRLVLNVGHGMLGWTLSMGAAERAAELVLTSALRKA
jgi:D-amino-acid dehydrogenase